MFACKIERKLCSVLFFFFLPSSTGVTHSALKHLLNFSNKQHKAGWNHSWHKCLQGASVSSLHMHVKADHTNNRRHVKAEDYVFSWIFWGHTARQKQQQVWKGGRTGFTRALRRMVVREQNIWNCFSSASHMLEKVSLARTKDRLVCTPRLAKTKNDLVRLKVLLRTLPFLWKRGEADGRQILRAMNQ